MSYENYFGEEIQINDATIESRRFSQKILKVIIPQKAISFNLNKLLNEYANYETYFFSSVGARNDIFDKIEDSELRILPIDGLTYWIYKNSIKIYTRQNTEQDNYTLFNLTKSTIDIAKNITKEIFSDYPNYFNRNPFLPKIEIVDAYCEWLTDAVKLKNNSSLICYEDNKPIGIILYEASNDVIEILLAGINPANRKKGKYLRMMEKFINEYSEGKNIVISTHISNINVQKSWVNLNFKPHLYVERFHVSRK
jgi:hypothetical protein